MIIFNIVKKALVVFSILLSILLTAGASAYLVANIAPFLAAELAITLVVITFLFILWVVLEELLG